MQVLQAFLASTRDGQVRSAMSKHIKKYDKQEVRKRRDSIEAEKFRVRTRRDSSREIRSGFHRRLYSPPTKVEIEKKKRNELSEKYREALLDNMSQYNEIVNSYESPIEAAKKKKRKKSNPFKKTKSRVYDYQKKHHNSIRQKNTERDKIRRRLDEFHKMNTRFKPRKRFRSPKRLRSPIRTRKRIVKRIVKRKSPKKIISRSRSPKTRRKRVTPKKKKIKVIRKKKKMGDITSSEDEPMMNVLTVKVVMTPKRQRTEESKYFGEDLEDISSSKDEINDFFIENDVLLQELNNVQENTVKLLQQKRDSEKRTSIEEMKEVEVEDVPSSFDQPLKGEEDFFNWKIEEEIERLKELEKIEKEMQKDLADYREELGEEES